MADEKPKDANGDDASPYKPEPRPPTSDLVTALIAEFGSKDRALEKIAAERWNDRERVRVAEAETKDLRAKLPKGSRVLSEDEGKEYDAYKALSLAPADVKKLQTRATELEAKETERAESELWAEAATIAEFTKPGALAKLGKLEGFRVEVRDEKEDGTPVRRAYAVTGVGDKAERTPLGEYIESNHADFLPALTAGDEKPNAAPTVAAPKYPAQSPRGAAPAPKVKTQEQLMEAKRASGMYTV